MSKDSNEDKCNYPQCDCKEFGDCIKRVKQVEKSKRNLKKEINGGGI